MKIQIISLTKNDYKERKIGRWYYLPEEFVKQGHKVKYNLRKDWWRWYFDYLTFKPDVVITFGIIGGFVGMLKKIGLIRKPLVLDWNDYYAEIMGKKRGIASIAFLEYLGVSAADLVIAPSKYLVSIAYNMGKKAFFIDHGVSEYMDSNAKISINTKKMKFLYVGELSPYKRTDLVMKAFKDVNAELYLIGEPTKEIEKLALPNTHFLGKMDQKEVVKYINSVDVCIDSQDQDTSLKLREYAYRGKAILGTNGRKAYVFSHMKNIYLADDLREGILYLSKNKKVMESIGKEAKKLPIFHWSKIAKNYVDLIKEELKK